MKLVSIVGAIVLCILAARWIVGREDVGTAGQSTADVDGAGAGQHAEGGGPALQRPQARTPGMPSERFSTYPESEPESEREPGSDAVRNASTSTAAAARDPSPLAASNAAATETAVGPGKLQTESRPIDKSACEAAARTLKASESIFDLTATHAIHYKPSRPGDRPSAGNDLRARLLAPLCSGAEEFDSTYPVESQFVAISADSYVRIFVGDHWISDGTVLTFLSEDDQNFFGDSYIQRRRVGPGPNTTREKFERQLARNPRALLGLQ